MVTYQPTAEARALVVTLPMARLVTIWQTNTPVEHRASPSASKPAVPHCQILHDFSDADVANIKC